MRTPPRPLPPPVVVASSVTPDTAEVQVTGANTRRATVYRRGISGAIYVSQSSDSVCRRTAGAHTSPDRCSRYADIDFDGGGSRGGGNAVIAGEDVPSSSSGGDDVAVDVYGGAIGVGDGELRSFACVGEGSVPWGPERAMQVMER